MTLKEIQAAILRNPHDRDIAFLLAFYHNELVTKNSIDISTIDNLFAWSISQGIDKIGLYASIGLLRHFFHMKGMISNWKGLRDTLKAWMVDTKYHDIDRALCGLHDEPNPVM
jgi:hypothetical protein